MQTTLETVPSAEWKTYSTNAIHTKTVFIYLWFPDAIITKCLPPVCAIEGLTLSTCDIHSGVNNSLRCIKYIVLIVRQLNTFDHWNIYQLVKRSYIKIWCLNPTELFFPPEGSHTHSLCHRIQSSTFIIMHTCWYSHSINVVSTPPEGCHTCKIYHHI